MVAAVPINPTPAAALAVAAAIRSVAGRSRASPHLLKPEARGVLFVADRLKAELRARFTKTGLLRNKIDTSNYETPTKNPDIDTGSADLLGNLIDRRLYDLAPLPVGAADAPNPIQIEEWEVPFGGHTRDPFAAGADTIWFVGQRAHYLGRFTPATGAFFKLDLRDAAGPHNLIVGSDGIVWYAGNRRGHIGCFDPPSGVFEKVAMPDAAARDPHTLLFSKDERYIWFTVQNGKIVGCLG